MLIKNSLQDMPLSLSPNKVLGMTQAAAAAAEVALERD